VNLVNRQIHLVARPRGSAETGNFRLVAQPLRGLRPGEVLVRNHYLSLDPYMRGRMDERRGYAAPQPLDQVMIGGTVGQVVASTHDGYQVGEHVVAIGGWQEYLLADAPRL
jgi:NADPH-dependent curcumin reductase CurA